MDCLQNLRNERPAGTFVLAMVLEQESPGKIECVECMHEAELKKNTSYVVTEKED